MIAVKALGPAPGSRVLDMCAAPGGKSAYMAELMEDRGSITACDIHSHRLDLIKAYARRTGATIIDTMLADASEANDAFTESFDYVLADVPCSGLGVVASKPEIKLTTDPARYDDLVELQKKIAKNAYRCLKPGGRMMYSTCTLNKNENEEVAKHLLSTTLGSSQSIEMRTIMPYNGEVGFFYCVIEKKPVDNK
jgi:16S rRNA (cytosine967-C5)-methyltransferase